MNQSEVNKIITEKVLGQCWHEWTGTYSYRPRQCPKCKIFETYKGSDNPDFSQWPHYGPLLEKIKASDWFGDFLDWFIKRNRLDEVSLDNALMVFFDVMTCIHCDDRHGSFIIAEFVKDMEVKR